jgi:hypothetical protein
VDVDHRVAEEFLAPEPAPDPHELRLERRARELLDAPRLLAGEDVRLDLDPLGVREGERDRLLLAVEDLGPRRPARAEARQREDQPRGIRTRSRCPG